MKTEFKLDFAIIGTQKGGTTSAMNLLGRFHPNVKIPRREMSFFNKDGEYEKGIDYYEKLYLENINLPNKKMDLVFGEKTPEYSCDMKALKRLKKHYSGCKLVLFLRNPITRAYSNYNMNKNKLGERINSFSDIIRYDYKTNPLGIVARGIYINQIKNILEIYDRNELIILISEKCKQNVVNEYNKIFRFIGVRELIETEFKYEKLKNKKWKNAGNYTDEINEDDYMFLKKLYNPFNEDLYNFLGYEIQEWETDK